MVFYALIVQTLAGAALVAAAAALAVLGTLATAGGRDRVRSAFARQERHPLAWAWAVAAVATAGSLYLSDVVGLVPCLLCWYQRIAMYPLVLVLGVGWWRGDAGAWRYALPLSTVGLAISVYHRALQARPALEVVQCGTGPPCTGRYLNIFGFVTIPTMAGAAFLLVTALLLALRTLDAEPTEPEPADAETADAGAR